MQIRYFQPATALLVILAVAGCEAQYKDVSAEKDHRDLIGRRCHVLVPLRVHGVGDKYGAKPRTDYIVVWNPGFFGPEVTFVSSLTEGTTVQVIAAKECSNCPFDRRIHYQVQVAPEPPDFAHIPVLVRAESFTHREFDCR